MRYFLSLSVALLSLFFSGCVLTGQSDYVPYAGALESHSSSEAKRISTQAQAIADSVAYARTETKAEKTLLAVIAMMQIERLRPVPLGIIKPTTGYDVLNNHLSTMTFGLLTGALGYFSYDAIKEISAQGGNTFNGPVDASGSFNNSELHQTYSSGATGTLAPYDVKPEVVR